MPDDEREHLTIAVARVEERLGALGGRVARIEWLVGVVLVAVIGGIVSKVI